MTITTLIVQARMGSSRLPGKSVLPLAGKPLIYRILERLIRCKEINNLVLAIPDTKENKKIQRIKFNSNIKIFKGSEDNLLHRYFYAAKKYKTDIVVRIPGDNCLPEPSEVDKIIKFYKSFKKPFFASNLSYVYNNNYPDGIGAEVFGFNFLEDLMKKKLSKSLKEHIHLNFFNYKTNKAANEKWCKVRTIKCPNSFAKPDLRLDVNTPQDYYFIKNIYDKLYFKNKKFDINDTIRFLKNKKKTFCFDIDNTICKTINKNYRNAKPKKKIINKIIQLHNAGHKIIFYTARYMGRNNNSVMKAKKIGYKIIKKQLKKWKLGFCEIYFKPDADYYIDDKFLNYDLYLTKRLNEFI